LKSTWNTGQVEQEEEMPSLIMLDDPELLGCCAPSTQAKFDDTDLAAASRSNQRLNSLGLAEVPQQLRIIPLNLGFD